MKTYKHPLFGQQVADPEVGTLFVPAKAGRAAAWFLLLPDGRQQEVTEAEYAAVLAANKAA